VNNNELIKARKNCHIKLIIIKNVLIANNIKQSKNSKKNKRNNRKIN